MAHHRLERLKAWWYHHRQYTLRRGSQLKLDCDDDLIGFLVKDGWIYKKGDHYFFSKKGSDELVAFAKAEIERLKADK